MLRNDEVMTFRAPATARVRERRPLPIPLLRMPIPSRRRILAISKTTLLGEPRRRVSRVTKLAGDSLVLIPGATQWPLLAV